MQRKTVNYIFSVVVMSLLFIGYQSCTSTSEITKISSLAVLKSMETSPLGITESSKKSKAYMPSLKHLSHTPEKVVRINFHFMNNSSETVNFKEERARKYVKDLMYYCHKNLKTNKASRLPIRNNYEVIPARYKYEITTSKGYEKEAGIYMHQDDELYYFIYKGKDRNLGSRKLYDKYAIGQDSILNIFMVPHFPDSLDSPTYGSGGSKGVALGTHVKISGMHQDKFDPWSNRGNFNHEVGHIFSLGHAWRKDGCEDTPEHDNKCFAPDGTRCDSLTSNNLMDYNTFQEALTPCQLGRVHQKMTMKKSRVKKFVKKTWCTYDPAKTLTIRDSIKWTGEKDLSGDIIIEAEGFLEICSRISMPKGGKILVKSGGTLFLNNAWLHNDCDQSWEGIFSEKLKKEIGNIVYLGKPKIENTSTPFSLDVTEELQIKNKQ